MSLTKSAKQGLYFPLYFTWKIPALYHCHGPHTSTYQYVEKEEKIQKTLGGIYSGEDELLMEFEKSLPQGLFPK